MPFFYNEQFEISFSVFWQSYNFLFQVSSVAPVTYALVEAHYQARPTYSASSNPPMSRPQQNDMRVSYTYGQPPTSCYSYGGNKNISIKLFRKIRNGVLFQKFVWPTERKNCSWDRAFEIRGWRLSETLQKFWDTSLEQFIQIVKGQCNFWNKIFF